MNQKRGEQLMRGAENIKARCAYPGEWNGESG